MNGGGDPGLLVATETLGASYCGQLHNCGGPTLGQLAVGLATLLPLAVPGGEEAELAAGSSLGKAVEGVLGAGVASGVQTAADTSAEALLDAEDGFAGASRVNPRGGTNNCVNCAIAGDATLAGAPASALDSAAAQPIAILARAFGGSFKSVSGQAEIESLLADAGPGSRGIVFGARGADPGHVFNAINQGGIIRFIDFQTGRAASFNGYSGFSFLWTNP